MAGRGYLRCVTALFLLSSIVCHAAEAAEHKRVMLLHSFGLDFLPWSEYAKAIRLELNRQSPWPLDFTDHALVTARSGDSTSEASFVDYLVSLNTENPFDLIVVLGAPAGAFAQRYRQRLFPATPMVFAAVDIRRVQYPVGPNDAVVPVQNDIPGFIETSCACYLPPRNWQL